jgi:hypothetical protein
MKYIILSFLLLTPFILAEFPFLRSDAAPSHGHALRGKRRSVNSGEFRKREKLFKDYKKEMAWEGGKAP